MRAAHERVNLRDLNPNAILQPDKHHHHSKASRILRALPPFKKGEIPVTLW
jgi:hypothetical protein